MNPVDQRAAECVAAFQAACVEAATWADTRGVAGQMHEIKDEVLRRMRDYSALHNNDFTGWIVLLSEPFTIEFSFTIDNDKSNPRKQFLSLYRFPSGFVVIDHTTQPKELTL